MSTVIATSAYAPSAGASTVFKAFVDEASTLLAALLSPQTIIREVEEMRALHGEAGRLEATDPVRAGVLRQRAAKVGLR